jgi:hypothetical protein
MDKKLCIFASISIIFFITHCNLIKCEEDLASPSGISDNELFRQLDGLKSIIMSEPSITTSKTTENSAIIPIENSTTTENSTITTTEASTTTTTEPTTVPPEPWPVQLTLNTDADGHPWFHPSNSDENHIFWFSYFDHWEYNEYTDNYTTILIPNNTVNYFLEFEIDTSEIEGNETSGFWTSFTSSYCFFAPDDCLEEPPKIEFDNEKGLYVLQTLEINATLHENASLAIYKESDVSEPPAATIYGEAGDLPTWKKYNISVTGWSTVRFSVQSEFLIDEIRFS